MRAIVMNPADNVCTVVEAVEPGVTVTVDSGAEKLTATVVEKIPFGHKFALRAIKRGEAVTKYGETIGLATRDILPGQHVHVHNLESCRGRGDK
ncbi:UxaA family hydrolase [Anaeroselena agilis]|uniref:UxaA family hydrolase n=1 Tax=Anaeroselena agilis TaxID=3063788 RepID=A0ABU3P2I8_9FIRM|nr:UxaA family hydrolase [Selenomonadales bacterium 4137-cl]